MLDSKSRYLKSETLTLTDSRGRVVNAILPPPPPAQTLLGIHSLIEGERIDHLAARYLEDPAAFWRLSEQNDVMLPEALSERPEIHIPARNL